MTIKEAIHTLLRGECEKDAGKAKEARGDIDALEEISKRYLRCESCGNEIDKIELTFARQDGRKESGTFPLHDWNATGFHFDVNNAMINNVGKPEVVRCPHCKKTPFGDMKVSVCQCTRIVCTLPLDFDQKSLDKSS